MYIVYCILYILDREMKIVYISMYERIRRRMKIYVLRVIQQMMMGECGWCIRGLKV